MFFDRQDDRQLSTTTQDAKGKQGFFLCLKQASSTRQVLEAKRLCVEDSHSKLEQKGNLCQPILEYQELVCTPQGILVVDQLG